MTEQQLLDAARAGDEDAYGRLVAAHRRELHAHCYRMLGSAEDAEDALQETLLRAWRGLPRFEGRSSVRSWLYRIATNAALRLAERRRPLVLPDDQGPPWDPHAGLPEATRADLARAAPRRAGGLRGARERRARVRGRAAAAAGAPARGADPARRARVQRHRGRGRAGDEPGGGRQRAAARARDRRRAAARAQPAGDAARARRRRPARADRALHARLGRGRRRRDRRAADGGRDDQHAAVPELVPGARRDRGVLPPRAVQARQPLALAAHDARTASSRWPATAGTARRTRRTACTSSRSRATGSRAGPRSSARRWSPRSGCRRGFRTGRRRPGRSRAARPGPGRRSRARTGSA